MMKNKRFFNLILIRLFLTLFVSCFTISSAKTSENPTKYDTLTFIQLTDPHFCNLIGYDPFFVQKRRPVENNAELLTEFLKVIPEKYNCDFVVITGDNIDYYEAQTAKGGMLGTQIEQYAQLLDISEVPVFLTLGNHDISSYFVNPDLTGKTKQYHAERARAAWIRNVPCFKDGTYYSRIMKIDTTTFRFIFLDNGYTPTKEVSDGILPFTIDQSQLLWLNDQLMTSTSDVEIIFMHIPLPFEKLSEKSILTKPISTYSSKSRNFNLLNIIEKNSSTRLIIAGHKHLNNINNYRLPDGSNLTQVVSGGIFGSVPDRCWRMVKVTNNEIIIYFPGSSKTEYIIPLAKK